MTIFRGALLLRSQGFVLVHIGHAREVLMRDQVATQSRLRLVREYDRRQEQPLQSMTQLALHVACASLLQSCLLDASGAPIVLFLGSHAVEEFFVDDFPAG